jgi:hypothetical protein
MLLYFGLKVASPASGNGITVNAVHNGNFPDSSV